MSSTSPDFLSLTNNASFFSTSTSQLLHSSTISDDSLRWAYLTSNILTASIPFEYHVSFYYENYKDRKEPGSMWVPKEEEEGNLKREMKELNMTYKEFYKYSVTEYEKFWKKAIENTKIQFKSKYDKVFGSNNLNNPDYMKEPKYLENAKMNIVDSCFYNKSNQTAIVYSYENEPRKLYYMSFNELESLTNKISNALINNLGLLPGQAVGICMQMTPESIAIYLGVIKAGGCIVSIADSFSTSEIETRLRLGNSKIIFTQDCVYRADKVLPLYDRVLGANVETIVCLPGHGASLHESINLRDSDWFFDSFLSNCSDQFESVSRNPEDICNILFSSGTTGEPKVIPWYHATPIKAIVDGYYHMDICPGEVVAWPTNIGWMMGPWLLFQLANAATIGLFIGLSTNNAFCQFIEEAKVAMLGVVPSLVKHWYQHDATKGCDWSNIKRFASTGESSSMETMLWLSSRAGYKPVIEYCGGTEIGGAYMTSVMVEPNIPSCFSTPALGSGLLLLDKLGHQTFGTGELALIPPALGLSTRLLNKNHHEVYYDEMPIGPKGEILRRHGDELQLLNNGYYRALGRCDDTMNIGGIKVSSIEIERVCDRVDGVYESAAIAVTPPEGGPSILVVFVVEEKDFESKSNFSEPERAKLLKSLMQKSIKDYLNPLFGITDVCITPNLPRTSSNKVMRRVLRDRYVDFKGLLRKESMAHRFSL